jgi:tetratricopeptide (TPR) repeat protein
MTEFFKVLRAIGALALALLIVLPPVAGAQEEIPITTKSDEARKIFLEGLALFDNVRWDEARELFAKAVEKDPDFATAYLYQVFVATSAMDRQNHKFGFSQRKVGDNLVFMGKYEEGREAYRKAMEMEVTPSGKLADMAAIGGSYIYDGESPRARRANLL